MSRRKHLAAREPNGQIQRDRTKASHLLAPTQVRRMIDIAASEARDPLWATMLGRLYSNDKISATEFASGKRWSELAASYSAACRSPRSPRTISFDAPGGTPIDPDSALGEQEVASHERISADWLNARNALRLAGRDAERVVGDVCEKDQAPAGLSELGALRDGLSALSDLWAARRKLRASR